MLDCKRSPRLLPIAVAAAAIWHLALLPSVAQTFESPARSERTARIAAAPPPDLATDTLAANSRASTGAGKPALFFGYVEFDVDPTGPGGVPGFGPWPQPSPPLAMTGPVR